MPDSATLPAAALWSFLLVLARVAGVVAFLPMPALRSAPDMARMAFALTITMCLAPVWPAGPAAIPGMFTFALWMIAEAALGILMGLFVSVLVESFQLAAQVLGLQAGFSYASTVDPGSQADSTVLQIFAQLLAVTLFFVLGLDRVLIQLVARSLETIPPGTFVAGPQIAERMISFTGTLFSNGVRLALPVVALLLLVDLSLALVGRMQAQLQLLTVAFPAKMLAGVWFFGMMLWVTPTVAESMFKRAVETAAQVIGR
jgi:flagellar biosynthesis protein FliR